MITNLHKLYLHQIKDLYSAEKQILQALPKMLSRAQSDELKEAFMHHMEETKGQKLRLERILQNHKMPLESEECQAIKGIIEEGEHLMSELAADAVDPGLIAAAQRVEHYEITAYGTTREYAKALDYNVDVKLLEETLEQEADANDKLTKIATGGLFSSGVNEGAMVA